MIFFNTAKLKTVEYDFSAVLMLRVKMMFGAANKHTHTRKYTPSTTSPAKLPPTQLPPQKKKHLLSLVLKTILFFSIFLQIYE